MIFWWYFIWSMHLRIQISMKNNFVSLISGAKGEHIDNVEIYFMLEMVDG